MNEAMHDDLLSLSGAKPSWSRRDFVVSGLASGFALAAQPICAQTMIVTDTQGLTAGDVRIPTKESDSRLRGDAGKGRRFRGACRAGDLRRSRAHQGHLPPPGQARLSGGCARALRSPRRSLEDDRHQEDLRRDRQQGSRRAGHGRSRRNRGLGAAVGHGARFEARRSRASAGAGASSGSTPRTIRRSRRAWHGTGRSCSDEQTTPRTRSRSRPN